MLGPLILLCFVTSSWAATVCCPETECFSDDRPFNLLPLPSCMDDIDPIYTMYTRSNPVFGEEFDDGALTIPNEFDPSKRTVLITHGYQTTDEAPWMERMLEAFLDREDINVILLGWQGGSDILNYLQAASNTRTTGAYTAKVFENLVDNGGGDPTQMWCVGHSLGSHVCGHTGQHTHLGRITGMDPAGPSFETSDDLTIGLNPDCADFVDNLHTDTEFYGTLRPLGHIDFYPAGGDNQPGCVGGLCSHQRACYYMTASVEEDCFEARSQCSDHESIPLSCDTCVCGTDPCALMGYGADTGCEQTGVFYLDVDSNEPYCTG